jgi:hypothetical protein
VCGFWDKVYGFFDGWVKFLFLEFPCVAAVSAFQLGFGSGSFEFCVFEVGWFELLESELENFSFHLLEFPDFHVNFGYFGEFLFFSDVGCRFDNCFGKCPFMHRKVIGSDAVKHFEKTLKSVVLLEI